MKSPTSLIALIFILLPGLVLAQGDADAIRQFRKSVFKLQQEMLQLKEEFDRQKKELQAQKEYLNTQVERLTAENNKFKKNLLEMDSLLFQFEDRLESSALNKLTAELKNLREFNRALLLDTLGHSEEFEKILLDIINQPDTRLPKDLLILILAQQKRRQGSLEESLSYYSTLLAEFFGSPFFTQGIYEMSEVLGELDKTDQQLTLLIQLSAISKTDKFSLRAVEKLRKMGSEAAFEDAIDATGDAASETHIGIVPEVADMVDATTDATTDIGSAEGISEDATGDQPAALESPMVIGDATGDVISHPAEIPGSIDASGDEQVFESTKAQADATGDIISQPAESLGSRDTSGDEQLLGETETALQSDDIPSTNVSAADPLTGNQPLHDSTSDQPSNVESQTDLSLATDATPDQPTQPNEAADSSPDILQSAPAQQESQVITGDGPTQDVTSDQPLPVSIQTEQQITTDVEPAADVTSDQSSSIPSPGNSRLTDAETDRQEAIGPNSQISDDGAAASPAQPVGAVSDSTSDVLPAAQSIE